jgi:hypothetical protein
MDPTTPTRRYAETCGCRKPSWIPPTSKADGADAPDLLDVDQAAGSAAHSVPRAMAGWLGCSLPPLLAGSSHSVLLAVTRP